MERLESRLMLSGWLDTSDPSAVSNFYFSQYVPSEDVPAGWTGSLSTGDPGTTTEAFKDAVLQRVNYYRAMAGVPGITGIDAATSEKAQAAALMMSANSNLSHSPPSSWKFYTAEGAEAAGNSNLALGSYGPGAIDRYMIDQGDNNLAAGHRRWVLYPQTQVMGTGDVPGGGPYYPANALWVIDTANIWGPRPETRTPYVAWPSPGFVPYELMTSRWSFSYAGADFGNATVTLTRNGSPVSLTVYATENGYGENSLVWEVPGTITSDQTQYDVELSNVVVSGTPQTFGYSVTSFSPSLTSDAPTDVALSASTIAENEAVHTVVGSLSTTDPNAGDTFTYSLVDGAGSADNALFAVSGDTLTTAAVFDREAKNTCSIRVRTTDHDGLWFEKTFVITVSNVNEQPTDITLSDTGIAENQPAGTVVGRFGATDPDIGDSFVYTLVDGAGSDDNASFTIGGDRLRAASSFNVDVKASYSIRVRVTDAGGLSYEKPFTITVREEPANIRGQFGLVDGKTVTSPALEDTDGDLVTFALTGGGSGKVYGHNNTFEEIVLTGTNSKSTLTIKVKKGTAGDGQVTIGNLSSDGLLKAIKAGVAILSGQVYLNTLNQAPGKTAVSLQFLQLRDASIETWDLPIASLKLLDWQDTDADPDTLTAPSIGSITVAGRKENLKTAVSEYLRGDLGATVTVAGGIRSIKVAGGITGTIHSGKDAKGSGIGSITAGGSVSGVTIVTTGSIGKFSAAALLDSDILVGVASNFAGQFAGSAGDFTNLSAKLGSFTVAGKKLPKGSNYPAYVSGVHISAPTIGTLKLANVDSAAGAIEANVLADTGKLTITALNPLMGGVSVLTAGTWKPGAVGRPAVFGVVV